MPRYNPAEIEPKWQQSWEREQTFATPRLPQGEKLYVLDMFPYPSGAGLHVGHPEGYTATDIVCRFERMRGKTVLHPMGFDAFGLPAEEYAIKHRVPPRESTEKNIANFIRQLKELGFSYDWGRNLATTDKEFFRWTQWIFLVLFDTWFDPVQQRGRPIAELNIPPEIKSQGGTAIRRYQDEHRLAYQLEAPVNWCPALGTVLANEEVIGGVSERGGHPVVRIPLRQWMLRITSYADRLDKDLEQVNWPDSIKVLQRNWIGRSTGAEVDFFIGPQDEFDAWRSGRSTAGLPKKPGNDVLRIYTTRPDTLFGATYMVIAPEHPFVNRLTTADRAAAVKVYCDKAATKSDLDRTELAKEKTGEFTGSYAINPVNGQPVPIWVADYVLISYGTGAIMAVPAHDERDYEFATKFQLPVVAVVDPQQQVSPAQRDQILAGKSSFCDLGVACNSGPYNGLGTAEFKAKITADLAQGGIGREAVNYKLRDWLFSRQRFWGEPFPILHELDDQDRPTGLLRTVLPEQLPVDLPELADFKPLGRPEPPLEKAPTEWLYPVIDGKKYKRETNTMPQWAGSCWYYLRFIDPKNSQVFVDPVAEKAWMPVDLYIGGAEHAVLHLLYARFWHKVLFDRGHVSTPEPFNRLVNQGMILGEMEFTGYQAWISASDVGEDAEGQPIHKGTRVTITAVKLQPEDVEKKGEGFVLKSDSTIRVDSRAHKMSKARGNVINPDDIVRDYGADSLRLYEMFMGPLEATKPWSTTGVNGVRGFLDRVWRMIVNDRAEQIELNAAIQDIPPTPEQLRVLHKTIKGVTEDICNLAFNTAIAKMMEFTNFFTKADKRPLAAMKPLVLLLSPFAPHIAEELWRILGGEKTLAYEPWPAYEASYLIEDSVEIPVQVNGKLRGKVLAPTGATAAEIEQLARADAKVAENLAGKTVVKVIAVAGKMVNFVVK